MFLAILSIIVLLILDCYLVDAGVHAHPSCRGWGGNGHGDASWWCLWGVRGGREGDVRGGRTSSRQLSNAARSKFLQGTSASFFFITRGLKIETGLDRDPEIDRGASLL